KLPSSTIGRWQKLRCAPHVDVQDERRQPRKQKGKFGAQCLRTSLFSRSELLTSGFELQTFLYRPAPPPRPPGEGSASAMSVGSRGEPPVPVAKTMYCLPW